MPSIDLVTVVSRRHRDARIPLHSEAERRTGFTFRQRDKSPKAASNLQFERPWDRFVPAKSVRKLTARVGVSKKFVTVETSHREVRAPSRGRPHSIGFGCS